MSEEQNESLDMEETPEEAAPEEAAPPEEATPEEETPEEAPAKDESAPPEEEAAPPEEATPEEVVAAAAASDQAEDSAEVEEGASTEQTDEGQKTGWPVVVGVIVAILALCAVVVCISAAIAAISAARDVPAPPTPAPVPTPVPTQAPAPASALIVISEPDQGQVVDIDGPVTVQGKGAALPEGNVVVEALDSQGNVLDRQPTTLEGRDVGTGGAGTWSVELTIETEPGTAGTIRAFSPSPKDDSIIAEDSVEVSLGRTEAVEAFIQIDEPDQGTVVDIAQPVRVRGSGAGLFEGNVVVEALDWQGNVLDQQPTTLQGKDVGIGGEGTWSTELTIEVEPGTASKIRAFSPSPQDGSIIAEDVVDVSLGSTEAVEAYIQITEPDQGAVLDIDQPVTVRGSGAGLPEGNVVVEAFDWQGNLLDQQPTTLEGRNVGTGGEGTWSAELTIEVEPGTAGVLRAFSPSPEDGSIIAEDRVEVSLGSTDAVGSFLKIGEPEQDAVLDVTQLVQVSGTGAGLPEGNLVVVAVDPAGEVLAEEATTLQGSDVGTGGEGTWSVDLAVPASGQTPGYIAAFSASPGDRNLVAADRVEVIFSGELTLEGTTWVLDKTLPDSEITAEFSGDAPSGDSVVSGSAGCNSYTGSYVTANEDAQNTIQIGPLASTRMMCEQELMDQEGLYLTALESATEYSIEGFSLSISYPGGTLLFYNQDGPRPRR